MIKKIVIAVVIALIGYNLVPLGVHFFPPLGEYAFLLDLFYVNPVVALIAGFYSCHRSPVKPWVALLIGLAFVPTMFIFYNDSASIYIIVYTMAAFIGCLISKYLFSKSTTA